MPVNSMRKKHRNLRKAAILLASLEAEHAETLLAQMSPAQADVLRQAVARLVDIDGEEQNDVIEEFFRIGPMVPDKHPSGLELDDQLPEHLSAVEHIEDRAADERPAHVAHAAPALGFLHEASAQSLAPFLEREHPQTIAVVVSHLPSERAAEILMASATETATRNFWLPDK